MSNSTYLADKFAAVDLPAAEDGMNKIGQFFRSIAGAAAVVEVLRQAQGRIGELSNEITGLENRRDALIAEKLDSYFVDGQRQREQIIADAKIEAGRLVTEANIAAATTRTASDAELATARATLAEIEGRIADLRRAFSPAAVTGE